MPVRPPVGLSMGGRGTAAARPGFDPHLSHSEAALRVSKTGTIPKALLLEIEQECRLHLFVQKRVILVVCDDWVSRLASVFATLQ